MTHEEDKNKAKKVAELHIDELAGKGERERGRDKGVMGTDICMSQTAFGKHDLLTDCDKLSYH